MKNELLRQINLDLERPVICEVRWVFEDGTDEECGRVAEFTTMAHDNAETHKNAQLLICSSCLGMIDGQICSEDNTFMVWNTIAL